MNPLEVFRHRNFRFFLGARLAATLAGQMQVVAIGWQVYDLTRRPLDLGWVGLAQFLPMLCFSIVGGHTADRFNRKWISTTTLFLFAMMHLALALLTAKGIHSVHPIFAVLICLGMVDAFHVPAAHALIPSVVPTHLFGRAVAWTSTTWQIGMVAGPALGGVIYVMTGGAVGVYLTSAILLSAASVFTVLLSVHSVKRETEPTSFQTLSAGVRYVWRKKILLGAMSLDLFSVFLGGATALLPIVARDFLHVGPSGLGWLRSGPAIGASAVALFLAYRPLKSALGKKMFAAVTIFGLATILFGLSRSFPLSLACLIVLGAADQVSVVFRAILVQLSTPTAMRGRVSAVHQVFIGASNELGEFESGVTAAWFGTFPAIVIGGIGTCLIVLFWTRLFPELRDFDRFDHEEPLQLEA